MSSTTNEVVWKILDNIQNLYENVYIHKEDLWIKLKQKTDNSNSNNNNNNKNGFNVCQIISDASEPLFKQLQNTNYNTENNIKCTKFLHWLCALSMSFTNA
eukprot:28070_1